MREFVIHNRSGGRGPGTVLFVAGAALMVFGVLVLVFPELIRALVAAIFMVVGFSLLTVGWRLRNGGSTATLQSMFSRFEPPR